MSKPHHVTVLGGGIAGLTASYYLLQHSNNIKVTLIEAESNLGGKISTASFGGIPLDIGPDAFLGRASQVVRLCTDLGLQDDLIAPEAMNTRIWIRGKLRPLPEGMYMGMPTEIFPLVSSGIVSPLGVARAGLDLILPSFFDEQDQSVTQSLLPRLGREMVEHLVEPLVSGIHAGRADQLSILSVAPQIANMLKGHRSITSGAIAARKIKSKQQAAETPALLSLRGGLQKLVARLQEKLSNANILLDTKALKLLGADRGYRLLCDRGQEMTADAVVMALPASAASLILQEITPDISSLLSEIQYASVAIAVLGYHPDSISASLAGNGFLVPRVNRKLMTACTWSTSKWPHLRESGLIIFRCSIGRMGDNQVLQLSNEEILSHLKQELHESLGISAEPQEILIKRWPDAFPQHIVGHKARMDKMTTLFNSLLPGIEVAGASYHGLGLASCVQQGETAARHITQLLSKY